jgi:ADP-ribosylation factor GTPase-activating protein 2/3
LDCSATHRNMGVHTTFVRSVDLDEWTQRQIDSMRLGGNANAKEYFRSHGLTDMHAKIEKKYTSKAAVSYRAELAKQIEIEAVKRGEAGADTTLNVETAGSLLENLELQHKAEYDSEARAKLAAARALSQPNAVQPMAKKASELEGAKRLVVTPPNSGGLIGLTTLRKPASKTNNSKMLLKKTSGPTKLGGVSKLVMNNNNTTAAVTDRSSDGAFGDIASMEQAETAAAAAEEAQAAAARQKEAADKAAAAAAAAEALKSPTPQPPVNGVSSPRTLQDGVARLQEMNSDFFSNF